MKVTESQQKIIEILQQKMPFLQFEKEEAHSVRILNKNVLIAKFNIKERHWYYTICGFDKTSFIYPKGKGWHQKIVEDFVRSILFEVEGEDSYYKISCRLADLHDLLIGSIPDSKISALRYGAFTIDDLVGLNGPACLFVSLSRSISVMSKQNIFELLDYFKEDRSLDQFRKVLAFNLDLAPYFSLWHYEKVNV
jgi:hypothetical protein